MSNHPQDAKCAVRVNILYQVLCACLTYIIMPITRIIYYFLTLVNRAYFVVVIV